MTLLNSTTARQMIADATDLDELLAALREIEASLAESQDEQGTPLAVRVDELVDVTSLPTYGGEEPDDLRGCWSWDASRLLVGAGSWAECLIIEREDVAR